MKIIKICKKNILITILKYLCLVIFSAIILLPLLIVIFGAFKSSSELFNNPFAIPKKFIFNNFKTAFIQGNMLIYFKNTILVSFISISLLITFSTLAAYSVSRRCFKFSNLLYLYFVFGIIIPPQAIMIPSYMMMSKLGLINNLWSIIIIYIASCIPFSIFILTGFFKSIPEELCEAAYIDGCKQTHVFLKIILPLSKPAISSVIILNLLIIWNDFYNPLLYIRSENIKTISLGLSKYMGRYLTNYPIMFSAVVMASVPVIIVFIILQKYFVAGITSGAVKG